MKKVDLAKRIKAVSYSTGKFVLRSGKTSPFYWDKYRFESDPKLLNDIVDEVMKLLPETYDKLAGMELGGIPLTTMLSLKTGKQCLYVRKIAKTYGTCNLVEGGFKPGENVVVIEDVITTAGQVRASIKQMRELGLSIEHCVCVIDRQEGGSKNLKDIGCSLASVFTQAELERLANE